MDEQSKIAVGLAADLAKQLITLGGGILALSFTFLKELSKAHHRRSKWLLVGWLSLVVSMLAGVVSLMALAGQVGRAKAPPPASVIYEGNIAGAGQIQLLGFFVGVICLIVFAWKAIDTHPAGTPPPTKPPRKR